MKADADACVSDSPMSSGLCCPDSTHLWIPWISWWPTSPRALLPIFWLSERKPADGTGLQSTHDPTHWQDHQLLFLRMQGQESQFPFSILLSSSRKSSRRSKPSSFFFIAFNLWSNIWCFGDFQVKHYFGLPQFMSDWFGKGQISLISSAEHTLNLNHIPRVCFTCCT